MFEVGKRDENRVSSGAMGLFSAQIILADFAQFAPQVGDLNNNLNRADAVLSKANVKDLDLLVLPELAFSGELLQSDISPVPTSQLFCLV